MLKSYFGLLLCLFFLFTVQNVSKSSLPIMAEKNAITKITPVQQHGKLHVSGTQLMDKNNQPVVLHGMSFGWHNWWPRFYNAGVVKELVQKWNCSVLRIAVGVEPDGGYIQDPASAEKLLNEVAGACIKEGIYVIIDWHSHSIKQAEAIHFFTKIAKKYGKYPNIIYEIFNEPDDHQNWPDVKAYSEAVIKTIRKYDGDNIVLVGSPHWDQDVHLAAADPIKGFSNLMYTMHFYAGTHKQWLRDRTKDAIKKGLPIFISECAGMEASGDGPIDKDEWNKWTQWMNEHSLSSIMWSISDKDESCSILKPSAASNGNWKEEDIKEWGKIARESLFNE